MPLSEHEQELLEQMEQALTAEDPTFAPQMHLALTKKAAIRRRTAIGVLGALLGLAVVLVGVSTTIWLGGAGFAVMVASVAHAVGSPRRHDLGTRIRSGDQ